MTERKFTHPRDARPGHQWQTIKGRPARILCHDYANTKYPIIAIITWPSGDESVRTYKEDGAYLDDSDSLSLCDVPVKHVRYVNMYPEEGRIGKVHKTKDAADWSASESRVACIRVEYEGGQYDE